MAGSLSERLAALTDPQPALVDKEPEEEDTVTGARVEEGEGDDAEFGEEVSGQSRLRAAAAGGLEGEERYRGRKGKRRLLDQDQREHQAAELGHMFGEGDEDEDEDGDEDDEEMEDGGETDGLTFDPDANYADYGDMEEGSDEEAEEEEGEEGSDSEEDAEPAEEPVSLSGLVRRDAPEPALKAAAVAAQLAAWDGLLEQRILLQKLLAKANTFPQDLTAFLAPGDAGHAAEAARAAAALERLVRRAGEVGRGLQGGSLEEVVGAELLPAGAGLEETGRWLAEVHRAAEPGRRAGLAGWEERTARLGGFSSLHTPALQQVDQIMANPARLVARTRVRRAEYRVLGGRGDRGQQDRQIFDDSDFYHTLLRELIERKTTGSGEAGQAGRQWLQVQKMRSKLRKKVDTRASKGRKIRYDVHAKLVNFMAPVSAPDQMQDTAKNELFSSLFGVRKLPTTAA